MKYILTTVIIVGIGLYLNRSYAHIYSSIGASKLASPTVQQRLDIKPASGQAVRKLVYVALGDSLTAGVGATAQDKTYPYQLAALLANTKQAEVTLVNLAWPGATAADVLQNQVPLLAQFKPDVITLAIGVNDIHNRVPDEEFVQTISKIVDRSVASAKQVMVVTIPFIGDKSLFLPPYRAYFDWQTKRYNVLLNQALATKQIQVIDLYGLTHSKAMADETYYSPDHFHPSDAGYAFWSTVVYDHLNF